MKSTLDWIRAASALGWSTAVGSSLVNASRVPGALANVSATARERLCASSVLSCRTCRTSATTADTTSTSTITTCSRNTCPATLRPLNVDRRPAIGP